ncbi:hypothetical protein QCA50_005113 [Cerrena zonata]|uniref:Uncharacterized protein n=1 Tax=Cerrena zonata TaxID=2478898 RepID=A0AAW0GNA8_9APHY
MTSSSDVATFLGSRSETRVELAFQSQHAQFAMVAVISAWVWDVLISMPEEFLIVSFTIPDLTYMVARTVTLLFLIVAVIFSVIPATNVNCHSLMSMAGWLLAVATPCNALLFLIRILGIFRGCYRVTIPFTLLWMSTFTCILTPLTFKGENLLLVNRGCLMTEGGSLAAVGFMSVLLFDSMVFAAISWKVLDINLARGWRDRIRLFFGGETDTLGYISKILLQSGQIYYLAIIGVHILIIVVLLITTVPPVYRGILAVPTVALHNMMACRVFRLLKFGVIHNLPSFTDNTRSQIPEFIVMNTFSSSDQDMDHTRPAPIPLHDVP